MTTRTAPTTEELRAEIGQIDDQVEQLQTRRKAIVAELAKLPAGSYDTAAGGFTVRPPSRRFDADRAYASLPAAAQKLCVGVVPALVKSQIPPAALDAFMVDSQGANIVSFK